MQRLLLTGVPGWLGNNYLTAYGAARVLVAPWTDAWTIAHLQKKFPKLEVVVGDLNNKEVLARAVEGCSAVLHSAGIIHVRHPKEWFSVNYEGTVNLFQAAQKAGVKRFVYISSNAAGGASGEGSLMRENDDTKPLSSYGKSKKLAEEALLSQRKSTEVVILRPCMFYGTPVPSRHVEFFKRIKNSLVPIIGRDLPRSMVHIQNLVEACHLALTTVDVNGKIFYIADAQPYSIGEYVATIARELGVTPRLVLLPSMVASIAYRADRTLEMFGIYNQNMHLLGEGNWSVGLSIDRARQDLGYTPKHNLREGIKEAIAWCRARQLL